MAANGISTLATKAERQADKLDIAQAKREGRVVAVDGTITGAIDSTKPYYRARDTYDLTQLPTQYNDNTVVDNDNTGGLVTGRPWVSYSVAPRANSVDEGSGLGTVFDITTINVANGTTLYFTVTGSVAGADFVSGSLPSGSFTITSNAGTVSFDLKADLLTEGPENYALQIRTGSTSGRVVETSSLVTVNDTSLTPAFTVTPASINEGSSGSFTVNNLGAAGTYYYTINHVTTANADFSSVSGSFNTATLNGNGTFTITTIADNTTEGAQTFTVSVRINSINGTILVTSGSVTVNDTSLTP